MRATEHNYYNSRSSTLYRTIIAHTATWYDMMACSKRSSSDIRKTKGQVPIATKRPRKKNRKRKQTDNE